jgi:hypothetical protein
MYGNYLIIRLGLMDTSIPNRVKVRGCGFVTGDVVTQLLARPDVNARLVQTFADTLYYASGLISRIHIVRQETPEEKQQVIALLMLVRLLEIVESTFILAAHGVRQELHSLFRIFLDAYFLLANVCSDAGFVPVYFRTDEKTRLTLMNSAAKYNDELFELLNDCATAELKSELEEKIRQERIEALKSFAFAQRAGCEQLYDSMYRLYSASIHTSPRCLAEYAEVDADGNVRVVVHSGDVETIHRILYDTQYFFVKALRGVCEVFALAESVTLDELDSSRESAMRGA